jgi:putative ABC transport system permease protein
MSDSAFGRFLHVVYVLLSHYVSHPGQALFMAVGLLSGVALWSAVQLINDHARASYGEADQLLGAEARFWIRGTADRGVLPADYIKLRRMGFTSIFPVLESRLQTEAGQLVALIATDLLALPLTGSPTSETGKSETSTLATRTSHPFAAGNWLSLIQPPYQLWYPSTLADQLDISAGDQLLLRDGTLLPPAVIQAQLQQGQRLFMDVGAAMTVLSRDRFSYLGVGRLTVTEREHLESRLPTGLVLVENHQAIDMHQLTASLHTNLSALGLLSFAVGLFIVFNAVRYSLLAREGTLTTLREMGVSLRLIGMAIVAESLLWSVVGTGLGLGVGFWLAHLLLPSVSVSLQSLFGAVMGSDIGLSWDQVLVALLMTLAGVALALALPLWRKASAPILKTSSEEGEVGKTVREMGFFAGGLLVCAAIGYTNISSVTGGFVVIGFLMFGGALLLPVLVYTSVVALGRWLPVQTWQIRWAVSDALSQMPHLRIALMALLLTLTANIGVTVLVDSFRSALGAWLENRLSADIYIQSRQLDVEHLVGTSDTEDRWLLNSHERFGTSFRWQGRPSNVRGINVDAPDVREMKLPFALADGLDVWRSQESPNVILANEQVRFLAGQTLGSDITLPGPDGPVSFRIIGFFHDYGNSGYQFYLPSGLMRSIWPDAQRQGLALWIAEGQEGEAEEHLVAAGAVAGEWIWQKDIKTISFAIFDRTFAITAALNTLTLIVAGIALLAALMAVHQSRLPEYSHWRSLGLTYPEWLKIVAVPLGLMIIVTLALSLPLGFLLSWLLIHDLNVIAFGWTMPLRWSWLPALNLGLLTLAIVLVTLVIAVVQVRLRLAASLKLLGSR